MAKKDKKLQQQEIDHASTQEHIPVATVRDGILVMKDGGMRAVLLVNALNFSLKSAEEQNSIIYQYQSFINSLNFPIQILVQSRIMDLGIYLKTMQDSMRRQTNELLLDVTESYIDFVESLIEKSNIMTKRFYVIIPIQPITTGLPTEKTKGFFKKKKNIEVKYSDKDFAHYKQELNDKLSVVAAGLSSIGLQAVQLNTQQVIELLYTTYNPEEAITEKLTDVESLEGEVVLEDPQLAAAQKETATTATPVIQDSFGANKSPEDVAPSGTQPPTPNVPTNPAETAGSPPASTPLPPTNPVTTTQTPGASQNTADASPTVPLAPSQPPQVQASATNIATEPPATNNAPNTAAPASVESNVPNTTPPPSNNNVAPNQLPNAVQNIPLNQPNQQG